MENLYKYIYNIDQANYFIEQGAKCLKVDVHRQTKKVFVKFLDNDRLQEIYDVWNSKGRK